MTASSSPPVAWNWEDPDGLSSTMDTFLVELARCDKLERVDLPHPLTRADLAGAGVTGVEFAAWKTRHPQGLGSDLVALRAPDAQTALGAVYRVDGTHLFAQIDIAAPLPIADAALDWVYAEHLIEHVTLPVAVGWLREVRRTLRPGGLVRITTPDLRRYVGGYAEETDFFAKHRRRMRTAGVGPAMPERPAFMMNQIFYLYGHRWIYDEAELRYAFAGAGFDPDAMTVCAYRSGQRADVAALDQTVRNDETLYVEITV